MVTVRELCMLGYVLSVWIVGILSMWVWVCLNCVVYRYWVCVYCGYRGYECVLVVCCVGYGDVLVVCMYWP